MLVLVLDPRDYDYDYDYDYEHEREHEGEHSVSAANDVFTSSPHRKTGVIPSHADGEGPPAAIRSHRGHHV